MKLSDLKKDLAPTPPIEESDAILSTLTSETSSEKPVDHVTDAINQITSVINFIQELNLKGGTLAIGKLNGAIVKLQQGQES